MVELTTRRREISSDGANHHDKLGLRHFCVQVNLPSPIRQVQVLIRHVITLIQGLPSQIMQVVPLICHFRLYPPHHPHLHPPSVSFSCTTQPSSRNTELSHPSWSLNAMIMSCQWVQHTPSAAFTEYSIHWVQHTCKIVCLAFILKMTSWPLNVAAASGLPPYRIDRHQPGLHESSKVKSHCHIPTVEGWLTDEQRPSTRRAGNRPRPSTCPISLDPCLQVHLPTCSITAS